MSATHTPGPWQQGVKHPGRIYSTETKQFVASACQFRDDEADANAGEMANARLIAAAPTLLAACEDLTAWWRMLPKDTRLPDHDLALGSIRLARKAIAAARGE